MTEFHKSAGPAGLNKTADGDARARASRAGTYGIDISSYVSESDFECLKSEGYEFVIVRGYRSIGE